MGMTFRRLDDFWICITSSTNDIGVNPVVIMVLVNLTSLKLGDPNRRCASE